MAAELLTRRFLADLVMQTTRDNTFLSQTINDDALVLNNSVEIPNSGGRPGTEVNRSSFPATITERTDTAHQYLLESITADPIRVRDAEDAVVAYNKGQSAVIEAGQAIMEKAADRSPFSWCQGNTTGNGNIIETTGADKVATGTSQTGNRKALTKEDILQARRVLMAQDMWTGATGSKNMLITPSQEEDILKIDDFVRADAYGDSRIPSGVIGTLYGLNIWVRSRAVVCNNSSVIKTEAASAAATDQDTAVVWCSGAVRTAMGAPKLFVNPDVAEHYGMIVSSELRFGGINARGDNKGIVLITEAQGS